MDQVTFRKLEKVGYYREVVEPSAAVAKLRKQQSFLVVKVFMPRTLSDGTLWCVCVCVCVCLVSVRKPVPNTELDAFVSAISTAFGKRMAGELYTILLPVVDVCMSCMW